MRQTKPHQHGHCIWAGGSSNLLQVTLDVRKRPTESFDALDHVSSALQAPDKYEDMVFLAAFIGDV